jgi:hypothetical protein
MIFELFITAEIVNRNDAMENEMRNAYRDFGEEKADSSQKPKEIKNLSQSETEYSSPDDEIQAIEAKLEDSDLLRNLTLTMALERPRKADKPIKPPPNIIGEGFYWKEYPELEDVLYCEMKQYYEYSANSRQSKHQQAYNNRLVENIKNVAETQDTSLIQIFTMIRNSEIESDVSTRHTYKMPRNDYKRYKNIYPVLISDDNYENSFRLLKNNP